MVAVAVTALTTVDRRVTAVVLVLMAALAHQRYVFSSNSYVRFRSVSVSALVTVSRR
jgi:hypothetical protein